MKKMFALILCMALVLALSPQAVPVQATEAAETEAALTGQYSAYDTEDGLSFSRSSVYETTDTLSAMPYSFAFWIYLPEDYTGSWPGVIFGNRRGTDVDPFTNIQIDSAGKPCFVHEDSASTCTTLTFSDADVLTGEWSHLVFTVSGTTVSCYVNGTLAGQQELPGYDSAANAAKYALGCERTFNNAYFFKGRILKQRCMKQRSAATRSSSYTPAERKLSATA